jgi:uncharacterized protein YjbI with pentapeptide repeats
MVDNSFQDGGFRLLEEDDRPYILAHYFNLVPGADLTDGRLKSLITNLHHTDLHGATFSGLNLSRMCLYKTNMSDTDCRNVDFCDAHAPYADFRGANLTGSNIELMENLTECDLRGAIGLTDEQTRICKEKEAIVDA